MRRTIILTSVLLTCGLATAASAACEGGNGRGWASGKGKGAFEMTAADKTCQIGYPSFIDDTNNSQIPATQTKLTTAPKSGTIKLSKSGLIYTPNAGFTGKDKFCIQNTTPEVKGKKLSGCVTVTVN